MNDSNRGILTTGSIPRSLISLSAPMLLGILSMMIFNLVDIYFISKLGTIFVAALTLTFPVIMIVTTFTIGLSVGAMALISRTIGEGNAARIHRCTTDSLLLAGFCVLLFLCLGLPTITPLFTFLGATKEMLPLINAYMSTWYYGMIFFIVPLVGNNCIRATGDTLTPSMLMIIGIVCNIVLDPILIFGIGPIPGFNIKGAALASNISRAVSFFLTLWILLYKKKLLSSLWPGFIPLINSWRSILAIGFPVALSNAIIPLSLGIITKIIAYFGPEATAGFGIGTRIEAFEFTVLIALSTGISPFIGQNFGARQFERIAKGLSFSTHFSLIWGVILISSNLFLGKTIARLFTSNSTAIHSATTYLLIISASLGFRGIHQIVWTSLNVLSRPYDSMILEFVLAFALWIPAAFIGKYVAGIIGVYVGLSLSNILAGALALFWVHRILKIYTKNVQRIPG